MGCGEVVKEEITNPTEEGEIQVDSDGDGYLAGEDCDDSNAYINPVFAEEICDGLDNDCDNKADEDVQLQFLLIVTMMALVPLISSLKHVRFPMDLLPTVPIVMTTMEIPFLVEKKFVMKRQ